MNARVSSNVQFFFYYLIEGMEGVCFYGEVFRMLRYGEEVQKDIKHCVKQENKDKV